MKETHPVIVVQCENPINDYIKQVYEVLQKSEKVTLSGSMYAWAMMKQLCDVFEDFQCNVTDRKKGHIVNPDKHTTPNIRVTIERTNLFDFTQEFPMQHKKVA